MTTVIQDLETRDNVVSFAWCAGAPDAPRTHGRGAADGWQRPWGGVGQRVDADGMSLNEAMVLARVPATELHQPALNGRPIPGQRCIVRPDTGRVLGMVSRGYDHVPYADAFGAFLATGPGATLPVDTMGVLGSGEQAYATIRLHEPRAIGTAGAIARFLVVHTGHDGHTPLSARLTAISVVCRNTLTAAINDASCRVTVRHKRGAADKLRTAAEVMREAMGIAEAHDAAYAAMADRTLTDRETLAVLAQLYGRKVDGQMVVSPKGEEHAATILEILAGGGTHAGEPTGVTSGHTAWDLLQAGTFYLDRVAPPSREAIEGADAGELVTGTRDAWLARETTDSIVSYRQRLTDTLVGITAGADILALVGAA